METLKNIPRNIREIRPHHPPQRPGPGQELPQEHREGRPARRAPRSRPSSRRALTPGLRLQRRGLEPRPRPEEAEEAAPAPSTTGSCSARSARTSAAASSSSSAAGPCSTSSCSASSTPSASPCSRATG
ncbi:MAG: hypothetical protein M0C28_39330 [Candidatus Moduliflexus flocculans]|nr:hypothetical protein [Candidatus Moduliflexus flocculans]